MNERPGEEVATVFCPVILEDLFDSLLARGEDREPGEDGPDTVLFTNVIRSSPVENNIFTIIFENINF